MLQKIELFLWSDMRKNRITHLEFIELGLAIDMPIPHPMLFQIISSETIHHFPGVYVFLHFYNAVLGLLDDRKVRRIIWDGHVRRETQILRRYQRIRLM